MLCCPSFSEAELGYTTCSGQWDRLTNVMPAEPEKHVVIAACPPARLEHQVSLGPLPPPWGYARTLGDMVRHGGSRVWVILAQAMLDHQPLTTHLLTTNTSARPAGISTAAQLIPKLIRNNNKLLSKTTEFGGGLLHSSSCLIQAAWLEIYPEPQGCLLPSPSKPAIKNSKEKFHWGLFLTKDSGTRSSPGRRTEKSAFS